jgi:hypothetical protein
MQCTVKGNKNQVHIIQDTCQFNFIDTITSIYDSTPCQFNFIDIINSIYDSTPCQFNFIEISLPVSMIQHPVSLTLLRYHYQYL